jgi:sialate O-acetylesterase
VREPFAITVSDSTGEVSVKDCLAGLLILAGGQSNMEVPVKEALNPVEEAAAANYPLIREFKVVHDFNFTPQATLKGEWTKVVPATAS